MIDQENSVDGLSLKQRMSNKWQRLADWCSARYKKNPYLTIGAAVALFIAFAVTGTLLLTSILVYTGKLGPLPGYPELRAIKNHNASEVYSDDGVLLGKYYIENRVTADFEEISPNIINALIATEDARFFEHRGVDFRAAGRVLFKSILLRDESSGGGSTLSQQLSKNLYGRKKYMMLSMLINKMREMIIARRLENVYTKEELLHLYLNTVSFGETIYGIKVAAQRFFHKSPEELNVEEAAVLVGMLKATTYYNPLQHPERAKKRRNLVLNQMWRYEYLSEVQKDSLSALPLEVNPYEEGNNQGPATYFREHLRHKLEGLLADFRKADGSAYNLYTDGLKIYTTIDARLQAYAEQAVAEHMASLQKDFYKDWKKGTPWGKHKNLKRAVEQSARYKALKAKGLDEAAIEEIFNTPVEMKVFSWDKGGEEKKKMSPLDSVKYYMTILNTGFLAAEPGTGLIKAWVGGINHKYFKYDHVKARRQVGSVFKPIVYASALQNGMMPCEYTSNERVTYVNYDNWTPRNADGNYEGVYSMEGALSKSVNSVTVEILMRSGVDSVKDLAHLMGIESKIPEVPAIALGAVDASLMDMVRVYATFANRGRKPVLHYLDRIETSDGEILMAFDRPDARQFPRVLGKNESDMMIRMMESVVDSGTARRLRYKYGLYNDIAGKTGTTQNHSDGWFIGFNPALVAGVWVGAESPRVHFRSMHYGQGSRTALPIYGNFMKKVYADKQFKDIRYARFTSPNDSIQALMECPPYFEEMPILADYEQDYYYFEDTRSLLERIFGGSYVDEEGRTINVPPRRPYESDEEYLQRIIAFQQRLEEKEGRRAKRKAFWNKILFGEEKEDNPPEEERTTGYDYFENKDDEQ
jgi:penicillin-binding protein 1A